KEDDMRADLKPEPVEIRARETSPIALLSEWVKQGTESFFATQRILLDLVMRQNAMAMNAVREAVAAARPAPSTALVELAGDGMANFIAAQKILLELAHKQNEIVLTGVAERVTTAPAVAMTDLLRRSVNTFIQYQRHFLDVAAKQTHAWVESAKSGKGFN